MSDAVLVGLISVAGSIIVQLIVSQNRARESDAALARHEQKQQDSIDKINEWMVKVDKKLDIHNGYAEKFGDIQKDIEVIKTTIKFKEANK